MHSFASIGRTPLEGWAGEKARKLREKENIYMSTNLKQRLVVALILIFSSAIMSSSILKPFALVCYAVALLAIISALILAITNLPPQQRKLTLILVPITILVCGVGGYLLSKFLNPK